MQESGTKAETCGHAPLVADGVPNRLQLRFVRVVHLDVAEHREVIARVQAIQMRAQVTGERRVATRGLFQGRRVLFVGEKFHAAILQHGRFRRKRSRLFVRIGQLACFDFARFHIGLVKCVDADHRTCHGCGEFPAEEFLAQVVDLRHGDADNRLAGALKRSDAGILLRVRRCFQPQVGEHPVVPVNIGRADPLAIHWNDAVTFFARGLCDQLFEPRAQIRNSGRGEERELVPAALGEGSQCRAENRAGILIGGNRGAAGVNHFLRAVE